MPPPYLVLTLRTDHLLHSNFYRKQTLVLPLNNKTLLPVAWRLSGLEHLGDEFSFGQDQGVVQPLSTFPLSASFRAAKPVSVKKAFKIEVKG